MSDSKQIKRSVFLFQMEPRLRLKPSDILY
jgi:hypothetical protein